MASPTPQTAPKASTSRHSGRGASKSRHGDESFAGGPPAAPKRAGASSGNGGDPTGRGRSAAASGGHAAASSSGLGSARLSPRVDVVAAARLQVARAAMADQPLVVGAEGDPARQRGPGGHRAHAGKRGAQAAPATLEAVMATRAAEAAVAAAKDDQRSEELRPAESTAGTVPEDAGAASSGAATGERAAATDEKRRRPAPRARKRGKASPRVSHVTYRPPKLPTYEQPPRPREKVEAETVSDVSLSARTVGTSLVAQIVRRIHEEQIRRSTRGGAVDASGRVEADEASRAVTQPGRGADAADPVVAGARAAVEAAMGSAEQAQQLAANGLAYVGDDGKPVRGLRVGKPVPPSLIPERFHLYYASPIFAALNPDSAAPVEKDPLTGEWQRTAFPSRTPSTRAEAVHLAHVLETMLAEVHREGGPDLSPRLEPVNTKASPRTRRGRTSASQFEPRVDDSEYDLPEPISAATVADAPSSSLVVPMFAEDADAPTTAEKLAFQRRASHSGLPGSPDGRPASQRTEHARAQTGGRPAEQGVAQSGGIATTPGAVKLAVSASAEALGERPLTGSPRARGPSSSDRAAALGGFHPEVTAEIATWSLVLGELVRQVYVHCEERGVLLERARVRLMQILAHADAWCMAHDRARQEAEAKWESVQPALAEIDQWEAKMERHKRARAAAETEYRAELVSMARKLKACKMTWPCR